MYCVSKSLGELPKLSSHTHTVHVRYLQDQKWHTNLLQVAQLGQNQSGFKTWKCAGHGSITKEAPQTWESMLIYIYAIYNMELRSVGHAEKYASEFPNSISIVTWFQCPINQDSSFSCTNPLTQKHSFTWLLPYLDS